MKCGEGAWQASPTFTGLAANTEYTFYQRLAEDANHDASASSEAGRSPPTRQLLRKPTRRQRMSLRRR